MSPSLHQSIKSLADSYGINTISFDDAIWDYSWRILMGMSIIYLEIYH